MDYIKKVDELKERIISLIENNYFKEAEECIELYEEICRNDIDIYSIKASLYLYEEQYENAKSILKDGLEREYTLFDLHYNLAYIYEITKDFNNAISSYRRAWFYLEDEFDEKELLMKIYSLEYDCDNEKEIEEIYEYYYQVQSFIIERLSGNNNIKYEDIVLNKRPARKRRMKVLFAPIEIANQMNTYSYGLNKLGVDSYTLTQYNNYLNYKSDFRLNLENINSNYIVKISLLIAEFDVFHLFFGQSLLPSNLDLDIINELGKKIVMNYWGSDIRIKSIAVKNNKYVRVKDENEDRIIERIKYLSDRIKTCIVEDTELYQYVKNFYQKIEFLPAGIILDDKNCDLNFQENNKIIIVHAPTAPYYKGTEYIVKAIEKLKYKYPIVFRLVKNMDNNEAKKIYKEADIIIDQILIGTHGIFALEAMSLGKPVITYISEVYKNGYPKELPIISANPDNIENVLEEIINKRGELKEIGKRGIEYVKKYHDSEKLAYKLMKIYDSL